VPSHAIITCAERRSSAAAPSSFTRSTSPACSYAPFGRESPPQVSLRAHTIGSQWMQTPRHGDPITAPPPHDGRDLPYLLPHFRAAQLQGFQPPAPVVH
jgi:hypothetical protein